MAAAEPHGQGHQQQSLQDLQREIQKRQDALRETERKIEKLESHVQQQYTHIQDLTAKKSDIDQAARAATSVEQRRKELSDLENNFQEFMKQLPAKERELTEKTQKLKFVAAELERLQDLQARIDGDASATLKENSTPNSTEQLSSMKQQLQQLRAQNSEFKGAIQSELEAYKQTLSTFAELFPPVSK